MKLADTMAFVSDEMKKTAEKLAEQGKTPLFFAKNESVLGIIAVADTLKNDSKNAISELKSLGVEVVMITGDNEKTAAAIGAQAGVDKVIAGVLPEGKAKAIAELQSSGKVAMVGDGINDAPALTSANVGVAIGAGTDVAIDAADVVLINSRLTDVVSAIKIGRSTLRNIHQNLFWAFFYNSVGIPLAAGAFVAWLGWEMNPMFGAAAMSLSSFCVVSNALRLNLIKLQKKKENDLYTDDKNEEINVEFIKNNNERKEQKMTKTLKIEGMMCPHCEARVKKILEAVDGVSAADVSHVTDSAVLTLTKDVSDELLKKVIEEQGYKVL